MTKGFQFPVVDHSKMLSNFKNQLKSGGYAKDERFWTISRKNDVGNGVIRFLPDADPSKLIWRQKLVLNFEVDKKKFFGTSRLTFGESCPVNDWARAQDSEFIKKLKLYPKKKYISNILVIEDPEKSNEGKTFLYEYGSQVMEILENAMYPKSAKRKPLKYYDFTEGANFELMLLKDNTGYFGWKTSQFFDSSDVMEYLEQKQIDPEAFYKSLYNLDEVMKSLECPTYAKVEEDFHRWLKSVGLESGVIPVGFEAPNKKEDANVTEKAHEAIKESVKAEIKTGTEEKKDEKSPFSGKLRKYVAETD